MEKLYSFRLGDKDSDLADALDSLGKNRERSAFIIRALRFYLDLGKTMQQMSGDLTEIKGMLHQRITLGAGEKQVTGENEKDDTEEYVLSGVNEWGLEE